MKSSDDAQRAVDNSRWDAEHKRDEDRDDAQRAVGNSRWDAEHKRDEDREDAGDALKHSREDAALAVEWTLFEAVHAGYIAVAQGSLDRSIQRGTYITTAAASVVTLYTGLLALRFGAAGKGPTLPAQSLFPAVLLGSAVVFSTFYIAFLRQRTMVSELLPSGLGGIIPQARLQAYLEWVTAGVVARAWSLRLAVISLGLGLTLLPVGFVKLSADAATILGGAAAAFLILWIIGELYVAAKGPPQKFTNMFTTKVPRFAHPAPDLPAAPPPGPHPSVPLERQRAVEEPPTRPEHYAAEADAREAKVGPDGDAGEPETWKPPAPPVHDAGVPPRPPVPDAGEPPAGPEHDAGEPPAGL
jgi:hypothetical protein